MVNPIDKISESVVSVILPVYNAEKYLYDSIQSILNQTYKDFELIIVDDCSTDASMNIVNNFNDNRIKIIKKQTNTGISDSLNLGIQMAKGKYIARMDADDIAREDRFEKQLEVFTKKSNIILCGSNAKIIGSTAHKQNLVMPENHSQIFKMLLFKNAILHPSVMILKSAMESLSYDKNKEPAEDFDLWTKLIFKGSFYNVQDNLLNYRLHDSNISVQKKEYQKEQHSICLFNFYKELNPELSNTLENDFSNFFKTGEIISFTHYFALTKLYLQLKRNKLNININALMNNKVLFLYYEFIKQVLKRNIYKK